MIFRIGVVMVLSAGSMCCSCSLAEDKAPEPRDSWGAFADGSWIVMERVEAFVQNDKTVRKTRHTRKYVLGRDSRSGDRVLLLHEGDERGFFLDRPTTLPMPSLGKDPSELTSVKHVKTTSRKLAIQGVEHACEVKLYEEENRGTKRTWELWYMKGARVPPSSLSNVGLGSTVVRADFRQTGSRETSMTLLVVSLEDLQTIGSRKFPCVRTELVSEVPGRTGEPLRITSTLWTSFAVPGWQVREQTESILADGRSYRMVMSITDIGVPTEHAAPPNNGIPTPLPRQIVIAWEKAGAEVGWCEAPSPYFLPFHRASKTPEPGWLPAFDINQWHESALSGLPAPETPFGLDLSRTELTDSGLEQLAGMKQLAVLKLGQTGVHDAGLKHLAAMEKLVYLDLSSTNVTDAGLKHLSSLGQLAYLDLGFTKVTGTGLAHLEGLNQLVHLNLNRTDLEAKHLAGLRQLTKLDLSSTPVTDAGLENLVGMKRLTYLKLGDTRVTDVGMKHVAGLTQLTHLYLDGTKVKVMDEGLKDLASMKQLTFLDLTSAKVTDAGLRYFTANKQLKRLILSYAQVTDEGLKHLASMKQLEYLVLRKTNVTDAGIKDLRKMLPKCRITN